MDIRLKKIFYMLISASMTGCLTTHAGKDNSFVVFDNAASEVPYRIPAIAVNRAGDIIAVADYRYSGQDIGVTKNGKLDLRYRIKNAGTGKWSDVMTLAAARGEGDDNIAFGDPCIVADRESDLILVTSCSGNVSFQRGTHDNHQGWARFYSNDGGKTWSDYEDISDQVFSQLDMRSDGEIRCFFIGSGKISQSHKVKAGDYYRLYCAALVTVGDGSNVNYVFYSDDFGKTWNLLGNVDDCPIPPGGDEPKADELPDGSVLISSRIPGGRYYNIYRYSDIAKGEGKWDAPAVSNSAVNGVVASSNACNGEILCVPVASTEDGNHLYLLLQSVPLGPTERNNVGINYKALESPADYSSSQTLAADWDGVYVVSDTTSAYSTMTLDKDNNIAFLYEENGNGGGYDIVYKTISIEELTNGKYEFSEQ